MGGLGAEEQVQELIIRLVVVTNGAVISDLAINSETVYLSLLNTYSLMANTLPCSRHST